MDYSESKKIAGQHFQPSMRESQDQDDVQRGLMETHDLISGNYTDGTIDGIAKDSGNDLP
jgi:hypothetical protein